jgi:tRNA threonylcarbamoyladenosine biosynthesis protein TsaE
MTALTDLPTRVRSRGPEETVALAEELVSLLRAGDIVVLSGGIGAGKTVFAKGVARALGIGADAVTSPTFPLHNIYEGTLTLNHFDFYRLGSEQEARDLGIDELADGQALTLIEWGDRFPDVVRPPYLHVDLQLGETDDERWLSVRRV